MGQESNQPPNNERESGIKLAIFTDLDGTLLDHTTYSFSEATPALAKVRDTDTPLIFVTSKTEAEVKAIQTDMGLWGREPFVVENGGAIFLPEGYVSFPLTDVAAEKKITAKNGFTVIELGSPYDEVRKALLTASDQTGIHVRTIGDMSVEEFAHETGLSPLQAKHAKERFYQEGFTLSVPDGLPEGEKDAWIKTAQDSLQKAISEMGYRFSAGGRFYQIAGKEGNKLVAVKMLQEILSKKYGALQTVALGDAESDLEMLEACDEGILVANPKKTFAVTPSESIRVVQGEGPIGWNTAILELFESTP